MSKLLNRFSAEEIFEKTFHVDKGLKQISDLGLSKHTEPEKQERLASLQEENPFIESAGKRLNEMEYLELEGALETTSLLFMQVFQKDRQAWSPKSPEYNRYNELLHEKSRIVKKIKEVRPKFVHDRKERAKRTKQDQLVKKLVHVRGKVEMELKPLTPQVKKLEDYIAAHKSIHHTDWILAHPYFLNMARELGYVEIPEEYIVEEEPKTWREWVIHWFGKLDKLQESFLEKFNEKFGWVKRLFTNKTQLEEEVDELKSAVDEFNGSVDGLKEKVDRLKNAAKNAKEMNKRLKGEK